MYLHDVENYTLYINSLIDRDRRDRRDKSYIDQRRIYFKAELKKLDDLEKTKTVDQDKIQECLQYWHDAFENKTFLDDKELTKAIEKRVLPNVKKLGYQGSAQDICKLFLEWPEVE